MYSWCPRISRNAVWRPRSPGIVGRRLSAQRRLIEKLRKKNFISNTLYRGDINGACVEKYGLLIFGFSEFSGFSGLDHVLVHLWT